MKNEIIQKAIAERFDNLQPEIQNLIMSDLYEKALIEIIEKYNLKKEEMVELELNTTLVLLGEIHPDKYQSSLAEDLKIGYNILQNIVSDVEEKIFKNVRAMIIANWERDDKKEMSQIDIPLPPYAKKEKDKAESTIDTQTPKEPLDETKEKEVLEKIGIKMLDENQIIEPKNSIEEKISIDEDRALVDSGISLMEEKNVVAKEHLIPNTETQRDVLYGLENPPKGESSILIKKLDAHTIQNQKISNQSTASNSKDPYREQIG